MSRAPSISEIVMLPGLDGTGRLFTQLVAELPKSCRSRVLSYSDQTVMSYSDLASFVAGQIDCGPVVLLAESYSGPIAVMVARKYPERVAAIVLAGTFCRSPWPPWLVRLAARANVRAVPVRPVEWVLLGRFGDGDLRSTLLQIMGEAAQSVIAARLQDVAAIDVRSEVRRLTCPVLAIHGKSDRLVSRRDLWSVLEGLPSAEMLVLEGPHMVLQVSAARAAAEIAAFVKRVEKDL